MKRALSILSALTLVIAPVDAQERKTSNDFSWDGTIGAGHWLYVRNLNGAIRVERGTGDKTTVTAEKRWRRGNPDDVKFEVKKNGDDVIICAIWFERATCDEDYRHRGNNRWSRNEERNDVSVEFVVRVAEGVKLDLSSVNGGLRIEGATNVIEANTVNGSIYATSTGGPVSANTVNGSIEVHMGNLGDKDLSFGTVNGTIEVYVPNGLDAELDMRTVNGSVSSDFPLTVSGRINSRHIRATIGKGGRQIEFSTVNGSVKLLKS